jgi:glycosyltransferase involved in cell wall biosynthesis
MLFFSIILPTFNRAHMLHLAIESVLTQTYKDWELMIVDDGSTDNTKDVIDKFIAKDNRIRYLYQKNKERSAARNNGIKNAKGDWICFLDSDDIYHTTHLEEFKNLINQNYSKRGLYFSGLSYGKYSEDFEDYDLTHKNNIEFIFLNTIGTPRACLDKSIILKNLFNEKIKIGEDRELWSRILNNHPLYWHYKKTFIEIEHPNRSINLFSEKEGLKTIKKIINNNKHLISKRVKQQSLSNTYFNISKLLLKNNKSYKAFWYILISVLINISNPQRNHRLLLLLSLLNIYNSKIKKEYINSL